MSRFEKACEYLRRTQPNLTKQEREDMVKKFPSAAEKWSDDYDFWYATNTR